MHNKNTRDVRFLTTSRMYPRSTDSIGPDRRTTTRSLPKHRDYQLFFIRDEPQLPFDPIKFSVICPLCSRTSIQAYY